MGPLGRSPPRSVRDRPPSLCIISAKSISGEMLTALPQTRSWIFGEPLRCQKGEGEVRGRGRERKNEGKVKRDGGKEARAALRWEAWIRLREEVFLCTRPCSTVPQQSFKALYWTWMMDQLLQLSRWSASLSRPIVVYSCLSLSVILRW